MMGELTQRPSSALARIFSSNEYTVCHASTQNCDMENGSSVLGFAAAESVVWLLKSLAWSVCAPTVSSSVRILP